MRRVLLGVSVLTFTAGCGDRLAESSSAPAASAPPAVTLVSPKRYAVRRAVEQPGSVRAFEETLLVAKLPGYVRTLHADIGQRVKGPRFDSSGQEAAPGELLAELAIPETVEESREKQAMVRLAAAQVEQARKALAAAEAGVTSAEASVAEAKAGLGRTQALVDRWESESKRVAGMVQSGALDAGTGDETRNQFRSAVAARDETRARVASADAGVRKAAADRDKAVADVSAADARLDVARADARRLEALVQYTKVRAPYDGVVTHRHVNTGDFLQPAGKGAGVFTVARLDPVRVVVDVPEADAALVHDKTPVKLVVQALGGAELSGTVTRTSWSLDPAARTLRAEIDLPNPGERLRPGMYVYARITAELPETWALPSAAVVKQGEATVCFRVEGGKAVRLPIQTGRSDGQFTQVLRKQKPGSAEWEDVAGTEVVASQAAGLSDGQTVQAP